MTAHAAKPWEWRLALNHGFFDDDSGLPTFHAYDREHHAACEPVFGLVGGIAEPNEGSHLCQPCAAFVQAHPRGRQVNA